MTLWQRFGEDTWVNVDHVEVVRVEEQDDGSWQLTATFASGRVHPLGGHDDRELLVDCTDALLRGQVGDHLGALAATEEDDVAAQVPSEPAVTAEPAVGNRRWWRFWHPGHRPTLGAPDVHVDAAQPQPVAWT